VWSWTDEDASQGETKHQKVFFFLPFAYELMDDLLKKYIQGSSSAFSSLRAPPVRPCTVYLAGGEEEESCDPHAPRHCMAAVTAHLSAEAAEQGQGTLLVAGKVAAGWIGSSREGWVGAESFLSISA